YCEPRDKMAAMETQAMWRPKRRWLIAIGAILAVSAICAAAAARTASRTLTVRWEVPEGYRGPLIVDFAVASCAERWDSETLVLPVGRDGYGCTAAPDPSPSA